MWELFIGYFIPSQLKIKSQTVIIADNDTNGNNSKHFSSKPQTHKYRIDNDRNQW